MKTLISYPPVLLLIFLLGCQNADQNQEAPKGPFFGVVPTEEPQLLAPELIASPAEEYNGTFNADGTEFYYTTDIPTNAYITFTELQDDNNWSKPRIASFSGEFSDFDPLFSPDGSRLYFSSSRPETDGKNSNVWYVEKDGQSWGEPEPVILTATDLNEYYSTLTKDGIMYFNIWSTGNIFKAVPSDSGYQVIELDSIINEPYDKGDPFISPNEDYIIFRGYRNDRMGRGDLYISFKINGSWTRGENLGSPINTSSHETCPYVTPDGKMFIFASSRLVKNNKPGPLEPIATVTSYDNGEQNIYYMSTEFIERFRAKHSK